MKHGTARRLPDAKSAALEALQFANGKTIEDVRADRGLQLILQKLLEYIGEALNQAAKTDSDLGALVPNLRRFIDVRHRITHGYDSVDYGIIWQVVTERVPTLVGDLEIALSSAPSPDVADDTDRQGPSPAS